MTEFKYVRNESFNNPRSNYCNWINIEEKLTLTFKNNFISVSHFHGQLNVDLKAKL